MRAHGAKEHAQAAVPLMWTETEPSRLRRDLTEIAAFAPGLEYRAPSEEGALPLPHGGWIGHLPAWPFDRPQPDGLGVLLADYTPRFAVKYPAAYPMIAPLVCPFNPEPTVWERTQHAWHVSPDGSLCLLRSDGAWQPEASVTELLLKAAGWRIEYILMKLEAIEQMTENGIVSDACLDPLIEQITLERNPEGTQETADAD